MSDRTDYSLSLPTTVNMDNPRVLAALPDIATHVFDLHVTADECDQIATMREISQDSLNQEIQQPVGHAVGMAYEIIETFTSYGLMAPFTLIEEPTAQGPGEGTRCTYHPRKGLHVVPYGEDGAVLDEDTFLQMVETEDSAPKVLEVIRQHFGIGWLKD